MFEKRHNTAFSPTVIALCVAAACAGPAVSVAATGSGPELRLFPSTVVQEIQTLGQSAESIEAGLQPEIEDMERLMSLIRASQCEDAGDPGCHALQRQLADRYKSMLQTMDDVLPEMADGVKRVRQGLETRIASRIGRGTSASGLQEMLLGDSGPRAATPAYAVSGSSKLSKRFQQYYKMVAGAGTTGQGSLALVAADVYRDMAESEELIAMIRDQIARSMLHLEVTQVMPGITPEMEATLAQAKGLIFGEQVDVATVPAPIGGGAEDVGFRSPLEM